MKKSCLFGLTACLALCALPALADTFDFSGPYAGAQFGVSSIDNTISEGAVSFDQGATGVAGGGFAGYGFEFAGGWYVGGEAGVGSSSASPNITDGAVSDTESENYNLSLDAKAGHVIGSTLIYGKLGYSYADFQASAAGASKDEGFSGLRIGAGIETPIFDNFTGRIEGVYTDYESRNIDGENFTPSTAEALIGLTYHFHI
jgi:opacity protein-like surface antigen